MNSKGSIAFELKETRQKDPFVLVTLDHSVGEHTNIRIQMNLPNTLGNASLHSIQAEVIEKAIEELVKLGNAHRESAAQAQTPS